MNTQTEFAAPTPDYIAQIEEGPGDYYYSGLGLCGAVVSFSSFCALFCLFRLVAFNKGNFQKKKNIEAKVEVEEESEIQNIDEVDESNKWSSIKNLYGVLEVEWVLYVVGCAIISMNPLMIVFAQQNSLRFKCLYLAACLCVSPLPLMLINSENDILKCILFGVFNLSGILCCGLILSHPNVKGRIAVAASVTTLAMVCALTMFTFWANGKGNYMLDFLFLRYLSFAILITFLCVVLKQKSEQGFVTVARGMVGFMLSLIYIITESCLLMRPSKDDNMLIETWLVLLLHIYNLLLWTLYLMPLLQYKHTNISTETHCPWYLEGNTTSVLSP